MNDIIMNGMLKDIAIIGMSGRFPRCADLEEFWRNLRDGVECVSFFSDEELVASGVDPSIISNPDYVKAKAVLKNIDLFDASFFGYTPREAEIIDPQQRLFLEQAWMALENAGYSPDNYDGLIGVYASSTFSSYLIKNLLPNWDLINEMSGFQTMIGNDKDYLATRVSYKMDLKGPSLVIQTACSRRKI